MPTDLAAALRRRATRRQQENAAVLLLPTLMAAVTVFMALASPGFAASVGQFGLF